MAKDYHYPVMYREVLKFLDVKDKKIVVDCTVGTGSHAYKLLEIMDKKAILIGIDKDKSSLDIADNRLRILKKNFILIKNDFSNLDKILINLNIQTVDAFLFDLGISTYQLNDPQRGFSFLNEGPLDMRMDRNCRFSAYELVNNLTEIELANIFKDFGQERYYKKIAQSLVAARKKEPVSTTTQLTRIIIRALRANDKYYRIHPATRIFQSLRIAVNHELESLDTALNKAVAFLSPKGKIAVISFHSLEDRIVKLKFKNYFSKKVLKIITKKPLVPIKLEKEENPPSCSAKLRVAEKN